MMIQRTEASSQTRRTAGIQPTTPAGSAPRTVREPPRTGASVWTAPASDKKPNGDPCSLTLWGGEED